MTVPVSPVSTCPAATASALAPLRTHWGAVAVCALIMMVEGFDLLIYSNAIPSLLMDQALGMNKAQAGQVGSMIFIGMLFGGVVAGRVAQALGLARVIALGFAVFTVATALVAWAGSGLHIGALRLLAGLGLGVVLPAGLSLARKYSSQRQGALVISIVMSGIPLGGMLAAVASQLIIPGWGWRALFLAGGVLGLLVLAVMGPFVARLERRQLSNGQSQPAVTPAVADQPAHWHAILGGASLGVLALGTLASLADLLTWYGVAVWLTQLMREFDVPFTGAMQMMFTLNVGAIIGSLGTASLAMRLGTRPVAVASGLVAALCLIAIASRQLGAGALFAAIALLGVSAISAQNLVNALVADAFPAAYRAAAMGITLGLGRLGAVIAPVLGGYILSAGHGPSWVLMAFAISAAVGAGVLLAFTPGLARRSLQRLGA